MTVLKSEWTSALFGAFLALSPFSAGSGPDAELWPRWTAHDAASTEIIDHSWWNGFLQAYVSTHSDGVNRVAYGRIDAAERQALQAYLDGLAALPISRYNRDQQFAYWINVYNALTVALIVDHYPVESILAIDISPGLFSFGPWDKKLITVEGETVSLNDIEHRILRPIWRDPRIHYAVNCASISCPNLKRTAFTGATVEAALDSAARAYVNSPLGVHVKDDRSIEVSSLYQWYKDDFGANDAGVLRHIQTYAAPDLAAAVDGITRIDDDDYDWSLNDAATAQ